MQHLTRWRTVTAAATTAALAAGAFGIANAVSGNVEQPAPIELASDATGDDLAVVDDGAQASNSQVVPLTLPSPDDPAVIVPPTPASVVSAGQTAQAADQPVPLPDTPDSPDPDTPNSPDPDTPDLPPTPDSPDPDTPDLPPTPDSPDPQTPNSPDPQTPDSPDQPDSPDEVDSPDAGDSPD